MKYTPEEKILLGSAGLGVVNAIISNLLKSHCFASGIFGGFALICFTVAFLLIFREVRERAGKY